MGIRDVSLFPCGQHLHLIDHPITPRLGHPSLGTETRVQFNLSLERHGSVGSRPRECNFDLEGFTGEFIHHGVQAIQMTSPITDTKFEGEGFAGLMLNGEILEFPFLNIRLPLE